MPALREIMPGRLAACHFPILDAAALTIPEVHPLVIAASNREQILVMSTDAVPAPHRPTLRAGPSLSPRPRGEGWGEGPAPAERPVRKPL